MLGGILLLIGEGRSCIYMSIDIGPRLHGVLLDGTQQVGTVKILDAYRMCEKEKTLPDWTIVKQPMLWKYGRVNCTKDGKIANK